MLNRFEHKERNEKKSLLDISLIAIINAKTFLIAIIKHQQSSPGPPYNIVTQYDHKTSKCSYFNSQEKWKKGRSMKNITFRLIKSDQLICFICSSSFLKWSSSGRLDPPHFNHNSTNHHDVVGFYFRICLQVWNLSQLCGAEAYRWPGWPYFGLPLLLHWPWWSRSTFS